MDNVTRGLRELMKPIANEPPPVEAEASEGFGTPLEEKILRAKLQAFARKYLSETARDGAEESNGEAQQHQQEKGDA